MKPKNPIDPAKLAAEAEAKRKQAVSKLGLPENASWEQIADQRVQHHMKNLGVKSEEDLGRG